MEGLIALGSTFESFGLDRRIRKAVSKMGLVHPTLIQEKAIPLALQGKDILARAKTGSGKTLAYVVPVVQKMLLSKESPAPKKGVRCVVLLPTRELCAQVAEVFTHATSYCSKLISVADLGTEADEETRAAALRDRPDVIITTPARLRGFLNKKQIDLKVCFESLVVDEADLTLSLGYEEDIREIATFLPKAYQGYLMSATLEGTTQDLRNLILHTPVVLHLKDSPASSAQLDEAIVRCSEKDKFLVTYSLLRLDLIPTKVLIFVNSVERCLQLKLFLDRFSVQAIVLNAELPSESRNHILEQFNSSKFNVLIATDELFEDLGVDINELPQELTQKPSSSVEEVKEEVKGEHEGEKEVKENKQSKDNTKINKTKSDTKTQKSNTSTDTDTTTTTTTTTNGTTKTGKNNTKGGKRKAEEVDEEDEDDEEDSDADVVDVSDESEGEMDDEIQLDSEESEGEGDEEDEEGEESGADDTESANTSVDIKEETEDEDTAKSDKTALSDTDVKEEIKEEDDEEDKKKKKKNKKDSGKDAEYGVARGIDFKDVKTVINFDFPTSTKSYVHRIGRTARGLARGLALSLATPNEEELVEKVERKRSLKIKDFGLQLQAIESFRYRSEDVLAGITHKKLEKARAQVLRREVFASKKLKEHFKANPKEKQLLHAVHMKEALPKSAAAGALRNIPNYLLSSEIAANARNPLMKKKHKKGKNFYKKTKQSHDPVLSKKRKTH